MNTFWLKIAGIAILVVVIIVAISSFTGEDKPKPPQKTIQDQWEEDEAKLTAEPQFKEPPAPQPTASNKTIEPEELPKPQFEKLPMEEDIEAQRLWGWVLNQRKMGRLPIMGYKQMVDTCREIIRRWPKSEYAFLAKRALANLNEQQKKRYNITEEETDLGDFK